MGRKRSREAERGSRLREEFIKMTRDQTVNTLVTHQTRAFDDQAAKKGEKRRKVNLSTHLPL